MLLLSNNIIFFFLLVLFVYLMAFEKFKIYFKINCFYILKILTNLFIYLEIFFNLTIKITKVDFDFNAIFYIVQNFFFCYPAYLLANILFFLIWFLLNDNVISPDFYFSEFYLDKFFSIYMLYIGTYIYIYSYNFILFHNYLKFFNISSFDFII